VVVRWAIVLSRAVAVAELDGPERGLSEIASIADRDRLVRYPFYRAALDELELRCGRAPAAGAHFQAALALARNPDQQRVLTQRVRACSDAI
jgi:RNA polymerase sigma-70 factor (ECF subfamily)